MRHNRQVAKLQRRPDHRRALLANLICSLIEHRRIRTTLAKAKAVRPQAEKLVTLGKRGDLHARRLAAATLKNKDAVKKLFAEIAPACATRAGGYTRITKLGPRHSDSAPMAFIEWVDMPTVPAATAPATEEAAAEAPKAKRTRKAAPKAPQEKE